jgi:hypothetical protein
MGDQARDPRADACQVASNRLSDPALRLPDRKVHNLLIEAVDDSAGKPEIGEKCESGGTDITLALAGKRPLAAATQSISHGNTGKYYFSNIIRTM